MGRAKRERILRLIVLATLLCAGTLSGVRTFVTPVRAADAAPAVPCQPSLFARPGVAHAADCGVRAMASTQLPPGFSESIVFGGLQTPTSVRFSPDGRVFIAEKSGIIKVFPSLGDKTPSVVADLSTEVMDFYDRGLLSIALAPDFPITPEIYALYTYDAPIGGVAPTWNDACDDPFAATSEGCVVSGRLSRFRLNGNVAGPEQVLIKAWCQQFPSHSVGDLEFGPDGALYMSVGEGANYNSNSVDYGQYGVPNPNPCGDPYNIAAGVKEGGALRAQDTRTDGDPLGYGGTVLRVDPANPSDRRIVASGFRNPFRFAFRPGTNELWQGNVGWDSWETLNRVRDVTNGSQTNFGWPCYEGTGRQPAYQAANLPICNDLYAGPGAVTPPYFAYLHANPVTPDENCTTDRGASITGVAFYTGTSYPAAYQGATFFADFSRRCIWMLPKGANGDPDPAAVTFFAGGAADPVDLVTGPGGDLFYVDLNPEVQNGGTLRHIRYLTPIANISADQTSGLAPLTVNLDGRASSDPNGGQLSYGWDLDGDGNFNDAATSTVRRTYPTGVYRVGLRVSNAQGQADTATLTLMVGSPPTATITSPSASMNWAVGTAITFGGTATDPRDGVLPDSAYTWTVLLAHCPTGNACHTHTLQQFAGVAGGAFTAPDHDYPAHLELSLTVRNSAGLTDTKTMRLDPQTVNLTVTSEPPGMPVTTGTGEQATPLTRTVIKGSANSFGPPDQQPYSNPYFTGWQVDGQAAGWANPLIVTASQDRTIKAIFSPQERFSDVPLEHRNYNAIDQLSIRGIIHGYGDTTFGPEHTIRRAQMAVLIVRALGWGGESWPNPFPDQGYVDNELWRAVGTLNHYDVARGYPDGTYVPTGEVLYVQSISFIARAMVAHGYWQPQGDDPNLYPEVPASSGHRGDLATYVHYAGALPGYPVGQPFNVWDQFATRAWFSEALWQALNSYFGAQRVP